jgi:zinc/manganese transport system substrate-binding protein
MARLRRTVVPLAVVATVATVPAGCGGAGTGGAADTGPLPVVAAENMWGSLAAQLGGSRVHVQSIVASPSADPHDYEPTAADARTLALARLAIVNGAGYDAWASKLLAASPAERIVVDVGKLVGVATGGNPHRWYSPPDVRRVIAAITAGYTRLDPAHAAYFRRREATFERRSLAAYHREIARIRARYAGAPVGASESIFAPLAAALGLRLLTPPSFLDAISEGTETTAQDQTTVERQLAGRAIRVWVYNRQNATPDIQRLTAQARRYGIPVVTVTETLVPPGATFQAWQVAQLRALDRALQRARRR